MKNFWQKIKTPIIALAPMAGISDQPFRIVCKKFGADVVYSEMISAAALYYGSPETLKLMRFSKIERPYVVQLFGSEPQHFAKATEIITKKIKPDGIDINFGCPVKKIYRQGAGSALMTDLKKSRAVLEAVLANTNLPVSIKTRTAVGKTKLIDFIKNISDLNISALMIHGRTLAQGFTGPADWSIVKKIRPYFSGKILINGGINSVADYLEALKASGADGVGLGRGVWGRPWLFQEIKNKKTIILTPQQIFKIAFEHSQLAFKLKSETGLVEMRSHLSNYVNGLKNAKILRGELMEARSLEDIKRVLKI